MKPRMTCASCGAELTWGAGKCGSCGIAIDWPKEAEDRRKPSAPAADSSAALPVRNIIIVVALIAVGVIAMEYFGGSSNVPQTVVPGTVAPQSESSGANMSALPHIEELEKQVNADPENTQLRRELANHLMDNRFYDRAVTVYKQVLDRTPTDANVRVDLGICYKELGDFAAAEQEMRRALKDSPRHLHGHFNLGIVRLVQGDVPGATEWFKKTAELEPQSELGKRAQQLLEQHMMVTPQ